MVQLETQHGEQLCGVVRYCGDVPGRAGRWVGVEMEEEIRGGEARREAYLLKRVQPELTDPSKIVTQLDLWFPCWNKCGERVTDFTVICHLFNFLTAGTSTFPEVLTSSMKFTKEAARDIYLSGK